MGMRLARGLTGRAPGAFIAGPPQDKNIPGSRPARRKRRGSFVAGALQAEAHPRAQARAISGAAVLSVLSGTSNHVGTTFVNALSLGCVYALFALGFTLVFGVLGVINLAHGAVFMVGPTRR